MGDQTTSAPYFTTRQYRTFRDLQRVDGTLGLTRDETFIEYEGSTITIPMHVTIRNEDGTLDREIKERLKLQAHMRLEVFPAYTNQQGTREFQFIIRDWELFNVSRSLNYAFGGEFAGKPRKNAGGRDVIAVTFSLARSFIKYEDSGDLCLGPVRGVESRQGSGEFRGALAVDNLSVQSSHHGDIVWQIDKNQNEGTYSVYFYRLPHEHGGSYDPRRNAEDLVAVAIGLTPGEEFTASRGESLTIDPGRHSPEVISWRLGAKPIDGATGFIHQVSPPMSFCVADRCPTEGQPHDSADFPARITYSASYDIYLNNVKIVNDQAGVAMARNVQAIPPRDVLVAFEKPFRGEFTHPKTGKHILVEFGSGSCTGMVEISSNEWERGRELALTTQNLELFL